MVMKYTWSTSLIGIMMLTMAQVGAAGESGKPCILTFDTGLETSLGQKPSIERNISLVSGRSRQAAMVGKDPALAYPTAGSYDPKHGTVDMWVAPNWNSSEVTGDKLLWVIDNDPGENNRAAIGFFGNAGSTNLYFSNIGGVDAIVVPIDWKRGEWHHISAYWDDEIHYRGLAIDDEIKGIRYYTRPMPSKQNKFYIGYLPGSDGESGTLHADALIDEFAIYTKVQNRAFTQVAREQADYQKIQTRLAEEYSLDRVARNHIEVGWKDVLGLATPLSYRVPVEPLHHPEFIFVQPDMSISLGREADSLGFGFGIGDPIKLPDMWKVSRKLHKGYLPITESRWKSGKIEMTQTVLGLLPRDDAVTKGNETQYVVTRMTVRNTGNTTESAPLSVLIGTMGGSQNACYGPYMAPVTRWQSKLPEMELKDDALLMGGKALLTYRSDRPIDAALIESAVSADGQPGKLSNCLRFNIRLEPGETQTVDFVMAGSYKLYTKTVIPAMQEIRFDAALKREAAQLDRALEPGMKLITPEKRLNDIYKALILNSLGQLTANPDRPWREPLQTPITTMVWPWEAAHMTIPLMALGFGQEVQPSLNYFTERQAGIGRYSEGKGPEGDIASNTGCYTGSSVYWMNETGSVLWIMAEYYLYTKDKDWLAKNAPGILAAWDYLQRERNRTRVVDENGKKVPYYGLFPQGRVSDEEGWSYQFSFTDNLTWVGMSEMAKAFTEAGLPDADKLTREADEYRQCIASVIEREQYVDPDTGLLFIPNRVGYRDSKNKGVWVGDGAQQLFATGFIPATDKRFDPMVEYTRRIGGILMGLTEHYLGGSEWYINQTEWGYYKNYLHRGEIEKSLLVFYSNLVYGMSRDTYQTVERFHMDDPNFSPLQPNASGNGRILDMLRRMVIDDQDADKGVLWLLRGCPRRWFAEGKSVVVRDAITPFGKMALSTRSNGKIITVSIDTPDKDAPAEIRLVLRHPDNLPITSASVNGRPAKVSGDTVTLPQSGGHLQVVCRYD
ncbi:MAG: LamG-like jellyroll fold domain-containing protein [Armatimonadota bacterium]